MKNMELKIYKKLYEIHKSMSWKMHNIAHSRLEYRDKVDVDKKELKDVDAIAKIANKDKWEHSGILSNEAANMVNFLEDLLKDDAQ